MRFILLLVLFCAAFYSSWAAGLPKSWKVCNVSQKDRDNCLKDAAQTAVTLLINGDKTLGVPPVDPMIVDKTNLKDRGNENGPFKFRLTLKNYTITGYKNSKIDSFKLDCDKSRITFNASVKDDVTLKGLYNGSGQILVLAVAGSGDFEFNFKDYKYDFDLIMSQINKKDGKYFVVDSSTFSFSIPKARIHYSNFFNGNKLLEDNLDKIFNDNWTALFHEMKPSLDKDFGTFVLRTYVKPIVEHIPVSILCPA